MLVVACSLLVLHDIHIMWVRIKKISCRKHFFKKVLCSLCLLFPFWYFIWFFQYIVDWMNKDINSNKERSIKIFFIAPIQNKFQVRIPDKASVNIFIFVLTRQVEGVKRAMAAKKFMYIMLYTWVWQGVQEIEGRERQKNFWNPHSF